MAFGLLVSNCNHCLYYPIVSRKNSVKKNFFFAKCIVAKIVPSDYYLVLFLLTQNKTILFSLYFLMLSLYNNMTLH